MNAQALLNDLNEILLFKVANDTQIPRLTLMGSPKFREYWEEYSNTTEDTWTLDQVIEYALEMGYNGEFGDNLWED